MSRVDLDNKQCVRGFEFIVDIPEQRLKIEWKNVDIAFFERPYTKKDDECIIILESKKLWAGLSYAEGQAKGYADKHPECKKLIVSDGCCYKLFERNGDDWRYSGIHSKKEGKTYAGFNLPKSCVMIRFDF